MADDGILEDAGGNSTGGSPTNPVPAPAPANAPAPSPGATPSAGSEPGPNLPKPSSAPTTVPAPSPGIGSGPNAPRPSPTPTAPFPTTRPLYNPQFTAATQMILKRMKGEPSSLSTALSRISHSAALTTSIPPAAYEDAKRRLVMGMNISTQMTMQMPAASPVRPSPPATLPAPRPVAPKPINSSAGMSAIRKVTAGLTNASKPSPIKTVVAKVLSSESKIKKTKPVTGPRGPQVKRKRTKPQPDEDGDNDASSTSSLSSLEPSVAPPPESTTPLTPTPLTMTKSGRQVLKPDAYDPAAMDAASRRPRAPAHHYGKRTAEQALCLKCSRMHSPATNQIVFCDGCDECWHQLCHDPWIADEIVQDRGKVWYCGTCVAKKERHATSKRQKIEQQQQQHHPHQHHHHQGRGGNKGEKGQEKGSWAGKPTQQKQADLSMACQLKANLVGLLVA